MVEISQIKIPGVNTPYDIRNKRIAPTTTVDNNKVLTAVNGASVWSESAPILPSAEEGEF